MNRAYSMLIVKRVDDEQRKIFGTATTPRPDRVSDIVEPLGAKFANPLPLLLYHDSKRPVGSAKFAKPTKDGIEFEASLPNITEPGIVKDRVDEAWTSLKAGLIRGVSIGFRVLNDAVERIKETGGIRFLQTEIMELSLVVVPANADCTITNIRSFDASLLAATGIEPSASACPPGATGKKPLTLSPAKEAKNVKTIQEQITEWEGKRTAKAARQTEIMSKSLESGKTLDDAEGEEHDTLDDDIKQIDKHLARLGEMQKQMQAKAVPAIGTSPDAGARSRIPAGTPGYQVLEPKLEKGIGFARLAQALYISSKTFRPVDEIAKEMWPNWGALHQKNVAGATTTGTNWAAPLINYTILANDFIEYLRPKTIIGQFGTGNIPPLQRVPFNVKIPRQTTKASAAWVGEGAAKPATEFQLDSITLGYFKVATIAVATKELLRLSTPSAEERIRRELASAVIERIDLDFIDPNNAGTANVKPAAITNGAATVVSSGDNLAAIVTDVLAITSPMTQANLRGSSFVWIMNENVARGLSLLYTTNGILQFPTITPQGGSFQSYPVITSQYVPTAMVVLVAADEILLADDGNVTLDLSDQASIEMLASGSSQTAVTGTGASLVSMFQTNSVAFLAEREIAWGKARTQAVAYLTSANWGGTVGSGDI